jgi:hypothetical protein
MLHPVSTLEDAQTRYAWFKEMRNTQPESLRQLVQHLYEGWVLQRWTSCPSAPISTALNI